MGRIYSSSLPHTHTFSFATKTISKEYNNVSVSIKIQTPLRKSTHPYLQTVSRLLVQKKTASGTSHASAGKKQAHAAQLWGLLASWWWNLRRLVWNDINQAAHPILRPLPCFLLAPCSGPTSQERNLSWNVVNLLSIH